MRIVDAARPVCQLAHDPMSVGLAMRQVQTLSNREWHPDSVAAVPLVRALCIRCIPRAKPRVRALAACKRGNANRRAISASVKKTPRQTAKSNRCTDQLHVRGMGLAIACSQARV